MTQYIDPRTADLDNRDPDKYEALLAFQNAYRLKKKALMSEVERSLGFSLRDAAPDLSAIQQAAGR